MTRLSPFVCLMMVAILVGCVYEPDGDVITEIPVPEPPPLNVGFFKQTDTLLIRGNLSVSMNIGSYDPIKSYKVLIDDVEVDGRDGNPWSIEVNSTKVPDGVHTLTLVLTKQRIGKSMAAQMFLETYEQRVTRKIKTFNKPLVASPVTAAIKDGVLTLQWQPYTDYHFERYDIYATGATSGLWIVEDAKQNSLRIENFIAGKTEFTFVLRAFKEESKSTVSYETKLDAAIERSGAGLKFKWTASPFTSCAGFQIVLNRNGVRTEHNFANTTNVQELAASFQFPHDVSSEIFVIGKDGQKVSVASYEASSIQKLGGTSLQYHRFHKIIVPAANKSTLLIQYLDAEAETYDSRGRIALYNRSTGEELVLKTNFIATSPDGKSVFHIDGNTVDKLDPATLNVTESIAVTTLVPVSGSGVWQLHASNDNKLLAYAGSSNRRYFVYDWQTRAQVFNQAATFGRGVYRSGLLGNGGRRFYNLSSSEVLSVDTSPAEYFTIASIAREIPLPHSNTSIERSSPAGTLTLKSMADRSVIKQVNYPQLPMAFFANYENEVGIVYNEGGKIKIDFIDQHTLAVLTTLETQMTTVINYKFMLSGNELFVYSTAGGKNGPLHYTVVDFKR